MIFPDTYYPYPMGLPNFCYHLAIKEMAINGKIRLVSLVVYNYILPRKAGKCNNHPCFALPVKEDDCTGRRFIRTVCPLSSVSEPLNAVYTAGILRNNTGVDISALVGTPRDEAGTPLYTGVKAVPRPVRLTAYITYLRQSNRYDLVVAVSDTVKHLRP